MRDASFPFDSGVVLHVSAVPFDSARYDLEPCLPEGYCVMNGVPMAGNEYGVPQTVLSAMSLEVGGYVIPLDVSGMTNPWFVMPSRSQFEVLPFGNVQSDRWTVRGFFSSGAASYVAEWEVARGGSVRTLLLDAVRYGLCED